MKSVWVTVFVAAVAVGVVALLLPAGDAFAQATQVGDGVKAIGGDGARPLSGVVKTVVDTLLYFVGALSVIMIIYGGFKYITSSGESSAVASAKNTILYSVIGLAIAALAFSIVNFVVDTVDTPQTWADCNKIADLKERAKCQKKMIEDQVDDLPPSVRRTVR